MGMSVHPWGTGGVPTLLLHGFTRDARMWSRFRAVWSPYLRVVAPDLPGHGRSAAPGPAVTFDDVVDAVAAGLQRAHVVVGYSMGGRVALRLAARHPECVAGLVLDGVSPGITEDADRARRLADDERWMALLESGGVQAFTEAWVAQPAFGGFVDPEAAEQRSTQDAHALAAALRCLGTGRMPPCWDALQEVRCPVLLLNGASDTRAAERNVRMERLFPRAQHIALPGFHAIHASAAARWSDVVLTFTRQHGIATEATP
ncbi:MAG: alpha/beta fold hydrolase [Deltaproteobacteria bacterium]|nr:alpha/beta fold hydrolase [Deltaproteobacteria bacterium]